jgi:hypothetical protein
LSAARRICNVSALAAPADRALQRATLQVDDAALPSLEYAGATLATRLGDTAVVSCVALGRSASELLEIDVWCDQRDAAGDEPACRIVCHALMPTMSCGARSRTFERLFAELDSSEHRLPGRTSQAEASSLKTNVEACLCAHEALEGGSLAGTRPLPFHRPRPAPPGMTL